MMSVFYADYHRYTIFAECHKYSEYGECRYAKCHYVESHYAECRGTLASPLKISFFSILQLYKIAFFVQYHLT
jgi:hypothetical protein